MNPFAFVLLIVAMSLGIGAVAIILEHFQKMAKIREKASDTARREMKGLLEKLAREMAELRDTTTQYDMSFDAALQRMESRMANVERRVGEVEQSGQRASVNRS